MDIGIPTEQREEIAQGLSRVLADSYALYLKTHGFHWNVTGPMFTTLHTLFETQYTELALAVDEIAERIRALGTPAPGSYSEFAALSTVTESQGRVQATDMIRELVTDQEKIAALSRELIERAEDSPDPATADLATRRLDVHEKNAWMLRSHLE